MDQIYSKGFSCSALATVVMVQFHSCDQLVSRNLAIFFAPDDSGRHPDFSRLFQAGPWVCSLHLLKVS